MITKEMTIEELVTEVPDAVRYLMQKGIKCIACGEPVWETLESAAKNKGFTDKEIETFVTDLSKLSGR
jgi:hybrid cluster-associated redox disulfide protein